MMDMVLSAPLSREWKMTRPAVRKELERKEFSDLNRKDNIYESQKFKKTLEGHRSHCCSSDYDGSSGRLRLETVDR